MEQHKNNFDRRVAIVCLNDTGEIIIDDKTNEILSHFPPVGVDLRQEDFFRIAACVLSSAYLDAVKEVNSLQEAASKYAFLKLQMKIDEYKKLPADFKDNISFYCADKMAYVVDRICTCCHNKCTSPGQCLLENIWKEARAKYEM